MWVGLGCGEGEMGRGEAGKAGRTKCGGEEGRRIG